jgi:hypothetical protein
LDPVARIIFSYSIVSPPAVVALRPSLSMDVTSSTTISMPFFSAAASGITFLSTESSVPKM